MPNNTAVKKHNLKNEKRTANQSVSSIVSIPTPTSPGRSRTRHATQIGWTAHDLSTRWSALCEKYAGNGEEEGSVRFDWAHNGKKANGWIELLSDKDRTVLTFEGTGWGSGRGSWKAQGEDLEVCFGSGRHILSLEKDSDRWVLKEKYNLKSSKLLANPGTAGWPTAKGEVQSQKSGSKRNVSQDAKRPAQKEIPLLESEEMQRNSHAKVRKAQKCAPLAKDAPENKGKSTKSKDHNESKAVAADSKDEDEALHDQSKGPSEKLLCIEGDHGELEAPVCPGAKLPCRMIWGSVIPGLVSATLVIPPRSWNEKETLASNRTIMFYVLRAGEGGTLHIHLNDESQVVEKGDSICVAPSTSWFIYNASERDEGALRMSLISTENE